MGLNLCYYVLVDPFLHWTNVLMNRAPSGNLIRLSRSIGCFQKLNNFHFINKGIIFICVGWWLPLYVAGKVDEQCCV